MSQEVITVLCIILCTCAIVATTAYVMFKFRNIRSVEQDLTDKAEDLIERTKQINTEAQLLYQARVINEQLLTDLVYKENGTKELILHNKKIIELNKDVLRKSTVEVFSAKESIIYLHNHYSKLIKTIDKILISEDDYSRERLYALHDTANYNLKLISRDFKNTFNVSVEEYVLQKANIVTKKPDGSKFISPFSKN